MCGIVGYIGRQKALPILIKGLEKLEYRGYDSAGIACVDAMSQRLFISKERGKLSELKSQLDGKVLPSTVGIAHTRWATHGSVTEENAHPHQACTDDLIIAHNHPSGDPTPSEADLDVTETLMQCSLVMGIGLADHLIIGGGRFFSLRGSKRY